MRSGVIDVRLTGASSVSRANGCRTQATTSMTGQCGGETAGGDAADAAQADDRHRLAMLHREDADIATQSLP